MNADLKPGFRGASGNIHACAIELESIGILVKGASGSGKTSLCHGLIAHYAGQKRDAIWIGDDQIILTFEGDSPLARTPASIAGKAELFGLGIIDVKFKPQTTVSLVVELVPDETLERMPPARTDVVKIEDREFQLPLLQVPQRHESQSIRLVVAKLGQMAQTAIGKNTGLR